MVLDKQQRIVIAGGGIAGMAAWRALRNHNLESLVLERRTDVADGGLAINLPGNAIASLARLGLMQDIMKVGHPNRTREYRTSSDRLLASIDEHSFWGEELCPRVVRRADLLAMLGSSQEASAVKTGCDIGGVHQDDHAVHVDLANGDRISGDILIGADGVNSIVRNNIEGSHPAAASRLAAASWRFMAPNPGISGWTLWTGEAGMILLLPVDHETVYGWFTANLPGMPGERTEQIEKVFSTFPERVKAPLRWALERPEAMYYSPIEEVRPARWANRRAIVIGDAAHATAPVWAQGAALALEDAIALAEIIRQTSDIATIGSRFAQLRQPRVAHVQAMTDRMAKAARLPHRVRNLIMPFVTPRSYRATYEPLKADFLASLPVT